MDVGSTFIADPHTAIALQPGQGSLHYPAVFAQVHTRIDPTTPQSMEDAAIGQFLTMPVAIVAFVPMEFLRSVSQASIRTRQDRNGIHQLQQHGNVTHIGGCMPDYERYAFPFDHKMALRARFSAIRWIRAGFFAPPGAGTLPESMEALDQSIWSARDSRSRKVRWSASHTPSCCQSRNLRQQVMPLPQPISGGNISHGMPVLSTNRIPLRTARLSNRGRPPLGFGGEGGKRGSIAFHKSSGTKGFAIPQSYQFLGFC